MFSTSVIVPTLAVLAGQALAQQNAIAVTNNPEGVRYRATLPDEPFFAGADIEGNVRGFVEAVAAPGGSGVEFTIEFENLPAEGGPFSYHLHAAPAVDGNCTTTLAHLDPFGRTQDPACDSSAPETCEVGDLSGKHGKLEGSGPFEFTYTDAYASTLEGIGAFFGNRSVVIHYSNATRLTCANFQLVEDSSATPSTSAVPTTTYDGAHGTGGIIPTTTAPASPDGTPPVDFPGAGSATQASMPLIFVGIAAILFAL
jgi:hypothetical protein